jgi:hypothetical protein
VDEMFGKKKNVLDNYQNNKEYRPIRWYDTLFEVMVWLMMVGVIGVILFYFYDLADAIFGNLE